MTKSTGRHCFRAPYSLGEEKLPLEHTENDVIPSKTEKREEKITPEKTEDERILSIIKNGKT